MMRIYDKIKSNVPFCFVRINDGEASAIISEFAFISRGDEQSSIELSNKLLDIISDKWCNDNLFIGIPCINCYNECYKMIKNELIKSKTYDFIQTNVVDANILINNNYDTTLDILTNYLYDKNIVVISNENNISNISKMNCLNISVRKTFTVSSTMAFRNDYNRLKNIVFDDNTFIITLCGPLGRVLCYEWFKQNNTLSCLDLGSFFDPLLQNKSYLYHTNNHKYCSNCYPTSTGNFSKIFEYCSNYVNKECYYLNNYQDHLHLYNSDYHRIVLNTMIRIEKEPYNMELYNFMLCAKVDLINKQYGYNLNYNKLNYKYIIELCKNRNPKKVLCIGFDVSTIIFLEFSDGYITVVDNNTVKNDINKNYNDINKNYNDRVNFIQGNSIDIIPTLSDIYDIIFIDDSDDFNTVMSNLINCYYKSTSETVLIINNVTRKNNKDRNINIVDAYDKCSKEKIIIPFNEKEFDDGSGIGVARYNWSNNGLIRYNNLTSSIMGKYNYITSLINTIDDDNELKKIVTYIEENKLLKLKKNSNEGYAFQVPEQFEDLMNFCHNNSFFNILEIGFLHGSTSLMFLLNTNANVISIDFSINKECEEYLINNYPDRFKIMHGTSKDMLNDLIKHNHQFDLIYIDGGHEYKIVKEDLLQCQYIMSENCYIIMNDVVCENNLSMVWNDGPTKVFNEEDKEEVILCKTYEQGRGIAIFKSKKKDFTKEMALYMNKEEMHDEINNLILLNNNVVNNRLRVLIDVYLSYFSIILSDYDYYIMKYYNAIVNNSILDMEILICERHINKDIKEKCLLFLEDKYEKKENVNIPKIIHLIYINQRPLHNFNYKCIRSIIKNMPNYEIWIHNDIEPDSVDWIELKKNKNVIIKRIKRVPIFDGFKINHVQYEADIIRMELLYQYGGIYMDMDIYMLKDITSLLDGHSIYVTKETENSIINCVIISEPGNEFIKIWLDNFATGFRMNNWGWHIRDLPKILLDKYPYYINKYNIRLLDYENFCPMHWTQSELLIKNTFKVTEKMYGIHLFETILGNILDTIKLIV